MACRQRHELLAPAVEEWIGGDDERASLPSDEGGEGGVDLAFDAGLQDMKLHPLCPRRLFYVFHYELESRIVRVHEQGDPPSLGNQFPQQLKPFGIQLAGEEADARKVAARPGEAGDQTLLDRVAAGDEDDWDCRRCVLRRLCSKVGACHDQIDLAGNKVGGEGRDSIQATLRPAVFYRHVLSLGIAGFAQSVPECGHARCRLAGRRGAEVADHRRRLLLRAEGRRPYGRCRRRSAKKSAELAPPHPGLQGSGLTVVQYI